MRIAVFIVSVLLSTAMVVGVGAALVLAAPDRALDVAWLPAVALVPVGFGPVLLGSVLSTWDVSGSDDTRRFVRRWFGVLAGLQALGVVLGAVYAVLVGVSPLLPIAYLVGAVLLDLVAIRAGTALRRHDRRRGPAADSWRPIGSREVRRKVRIVVAWFVGVFVVTASGLALLFVLIDDAGDVPASPLLFGAELALLAAAGACHVVNLPMQRSIRERVSGDVGVLRRLGQVVLRGRTVELDPHEERLAARFAALSSVTLPFSLAGIGLIYVALATGQIEQLVEGRHDPFRLVLLGVIVVAAAVLYPLQLVRIRRARAYAEEHRQLL